MSEGESAPTNRVRRFRSRRSRAGSSSFGKRTWRVRRAGFRLGGSGPDVGAVIEDAGWSEKDGRAENKSVRRVRGSGRVEDIVVAVVRNRRVKICEFEQMKGDKNTALDYCRRAECQQLNAVVRCPLCSIDVPISIPRNLGCTSFCLRSSRSFEIVQIPYAQGSVLASQGSWPVNCVYTGLCCQSNLPNQSVECSQ
jgi:hypothetical protein